MSKLSLHISDWLDPDLVFDFVDATRPPLIKVFGNVGLNDTKIREAKLRSPATLVIGRMFFSEQGIERDEREPVDTVFTYDPIADAHNAFAQLQPIMEKLRGLVDVWEGYNEIPIDTPAPLTEREFQKARNLSAFTVELAKLVQGVGLKYAAYSFSTGNPVHVELWDLLIDGLRASDYLAVHEYIAPNAEWTNFNDTMLNRYRAAYERIPQDARRPVLITEAGADFNGEHGFIDKISVPRYMSMMAQYDREMMRDPYVVGATIYCYGIDDKRWKTYDIAGDFTRVLREHILANPTPPIETPVIVEPPPVGAAPPSAPGHPLRLIEAFGLAKQARDQLATGQGEGAREILTNTLIPWFYATAPQNSTDLANAQAHTTARWFAEEAVRRIETNQFDQARALIDEQVLTWLQSPGPQAIGILSAPAKKKKAPAKKRKPLKTKKSTRSAASKKATAKPKRRAKK
ncbi:MAG: hypothetical protein IT331_12375 [Anaerolineae bacterium]|nr:hypothetical protein [Anaerolineae bacterium]